MSNEPSHPTWTLEQDHKALLITASIIVKLFLMATVASNVFCSTIDPIMVFGCTNLGYVGLSVGIVIIMSVVFGYYFVNLKAFNPIFPKMMRADFIVTAMYFSVAFTVPDLVASKVMVWLFGIWIFAMLLAPFSRENVLMKKITEYGGLISLGVLLLIHFAPLLTEVQQALSLGIIVSSILSVFGAARND